MEQGHRQQWLIYQCLILRYGKVTYLRDKLFEMDSQNSWINLTKRAIFSRIYLQFLGHPKVWLSFWVKKPDMSTFVMVPCNPLQHNDPVSPQPKKISCLEAAVVGILARNASTRSTESSVFWILTVEVGWFKYCSLVWLFLAFGVYSEWAYLRSRWSNQKTGAGVAKANFVIVMAHTSMLCY